MNSQGEKHFHPAKLRRSLRRILKQIPQQDREDQAKRICHQVKKTDVWEKSKILLAFYPFRWEVDTRRIWQEKEGRVFLSVVKHHSMEFRQYLGESHIKKNTWGIPEPTEDCPLLDIAFISNSLMLVPGIAFDDKGNRIGWGGGYYDRWLETHTPLLTMGLAYEEQRVFSIEKEPWDIPMQALASPLEVRYF